VRFAVLGVCLLVSGCAGTYEPPSLPGDQGAVLEGAAPLAAGGLAGVQYRVSIDQVDGQRTRNVDMRKVGLAPGVHRVTVRYAAGTIQVSEFRGRPIDLTFQARAGQVYRVDGARQGDDWTAWIEDVQSGAVVAGRKP
jgi:hypothetical protein